MAHENLKFSLNLNNQNWQPILGNQDYNTFYMVYIKFNQVYSEVNDFGVTEYKYDCDFRIQNFRGEITMGFSGSPLISLNENPVNPTEENRVDVNIILKISPFNFNEIQEGVIFKLQRPIDHDFVLRTGLERHLPPSDVYNEEDPIKTNYLDPYRYRRDGDTVIEIGTRPYNSDEPFKSIADGGIGTPGLGICAPDLSTIINEA
ncbi:hypothetical protein [uncultured Aquimarina sp.]|uniref:hypothetical protein n=1 Tax=uncultured Aquimarina sp. TaxID=575652 RepID=UPI00261082AC|nr:hypothetical protein [uncultured Aquimarina sp.]